MLFALACFALSKKVARGILATPSLGLEPFNLSVPKAFFYKLGSEFH